MNFEQAKYKYNCYARDVLGLVGELEQPDPGTSNPLTQVINLKECPLYKKLSNGLLFVFEFNMIMSLSLKS